MYRVKQLFGGSLTLRDYDGQVAEAMALVRALNKMTKAGMPESVRIAWKHNPLRGRLTRNLIYSTKPSQTLQWYPLNYKKRNCNFLFWFFPPLKKRKINSSISIGYMVVADIHQNIIDINWFLSTFIYKRVAMLKYKVFIWFAFDGEEIWMDLKCLLATLLKNRSLIMSYCNSFSFFCQV